MIEYTIFILHLGFSLELFDYLLILNVKQNFCTTQFIIKDYLMKSFILKMYIQC